MKFKNKGEGILFFGNYQMFNYLIILVLILLIIAIQIFIEYFTNSLHGYLFTISIILLTLYILFNTKALSIRAKKYKNTLKIKKLSLRSIFIKNYFIKDIKFKILENKKDGKNFYYVYLVDKNGEKYLFEESNPIKFEPMDSLKQNSSKYPDSIKSIYKFCNDLNIECIEANMVDKNN